jgi:di/tricarboxylate transporter
MAQRSAIPVNASAAIAVLATAICAVLVAAPLWTDTPDLLPAAGVVGFAIAMWVTEAMPQHIVALVMFVVAVAFGIAPPEIVFGGFHASATWLVFGGLIITLAARRSGFANRVVQALVTHLPPRYFAMVFGIAAAGMLLAFIMPSASGRAVLMAPLAVALAERLGFAENTRARFGIVIAAGWGSAIPAYGILPSNVVNMVMIGAAEGIHGIGFSYFEYMVLNYPVMGVFSALITVALITLLFGAAPQAEPTAAAATGWTGEERRLLLILLVALALWITDFWHGISPAWVAIAAGLLCIAPRVGVMPAQCLTRDINYGPWLFVAGLIGLSLIANHTGLGTAIGGLILENVPLSRDGGLVNFYKMFAIGSAVSAVTTSVAAPPIMTAFAEGIAQETGWPLKSVLLAQVPTWMVYLLPPQAPPVAIAMALGGVPLRAGMRLLVPHFLIGLVVILPLQYWWGHWLGVYP